jgi:hypothetical protein
MGENGESAALVCESHKLSDPLVDVDLSKIAPTASALHDFAAVNMARFDTISVSKLA